MILCLNTPGTIKYTISLSTLAIYGKANCIIIIKFSDATAVTKIYLSLLVTMHYSSRIPARKQQACYILQDIHQLTKIIIIII